MTSLPSDVLDGLVASGRESGGPVAVVRDGVLHLEHAAGTRDGTEAWALDTLVMTFSVAKPFADWAFLDAVAEGHLDRDQTVVSVWPASGQADKEGTTLRHLLAHQAGLPVFPEEALEVEYDDREALVDLLARQAPDVAADGDEFEQRRIPVSLVGRRRLGRRLNWVLAPKRLTERDPHRPMASPWVA